MQAVHVRVVDSVEFNTLSIKTDLLSVTQVIYNRASVLNDITLCVCVFVH